MKTKVTFVRKDKVLFQNKYKVVKEHDKSGYVYLDNDKGVAILPYKFDKQGKMSVLLRDEHNPLHRTLITIVAGGKEDWETGPTWWQQTGRRELLEEAGIDAPERSFSKLDEIIVGKDYKRKDTFLCVDVTGLTQHKPETDGSVWEKKSTNFWVDVDLLKKMIKESPGTYDSYMLAIVSQFLAKTGYMDKSLSKAQGPSKLKGKEKPGHKYIRREQAKGGGYKYIYKEPTGKQGKKEEDKSPQGKLLGQLVELLGRKQGPSEEEKAPKKIDVLKEYAAVPKDIPDFGKKLSATQWLGSIDQSVRANLGGEIQRANLSSPSLHAPEAMKRASSAFLNFDKNELKVDDKKLSPQAQSEIRNAIMDLATTKAAVDHMTGVLNSSIVEKSFLEIGNNIDASDKKENLKGYKNLDTFSNMMAAMDDVLSEKAPVVAGTTWLKGRDKKLDFMTEKVFESVDALVKAKNRFMLSTFRFFIGKLDSKLGDLNDAFSMQSSLALINEFSNFNFDVMGKSYVQAEMHSFTNQLNMRPKDLYEGSARYLANAKRTVVNKMRNIVDSEGLASQFLTNKIMKTSAFNFLTLSGDTSSSAKETSEQSFAYMDMFGMDAYKQDLFFMSGLAKSNKQNSMKSDIFNHAFEMLEAAFRGDDVFNDEDIQQNFVDVFGRRDFGSMRQHFNHNGMNRAAFNATINNIVLTNDRTPVSSKIPAFIRSWSSFSHGSTVSNAIEEFVGDKGIDRGSYVNYHLATNRVVVAKRDEVKSALRKTINDVYNETQKQIDKDKVTLYRGSAEEELKSSATSWSTNSTVASSFGEKVYKAEVPKEAVLLNKNDYNSDYWRFPTENEHVVVAGMLKADNAIKYEEVK